MHGLGGNLANGRAGLFSQRLPEHEAAKARGRQARDGHDQVGRVGVQSIDVWSCYASAIVTRNGPVR